MPRRAPETLADYLVVAICPALIVFFVGSLMCFLVVVFYPGEHQARAAFVMAMFVMAVVCIARIAMEDGWSRASLFATPLALAVGFALMRLVPVNPLLNWALMALVWWVANKLTWDCTLIDNWEDVSGQGLLQQMGVEQGSQPAASGPGTTTLPVPIEPEGTTGKEQQQVEWWERFLAPDKRPHAPGVWVIYFSLAALPLFGIGGWFVSEPVLKARVFGLLVLYVASGMGLLLATSFLGLRRYLRQRKLEMPMEMTSTWILVGVGMIFAMLILATILPRPSREYSLSQLPFAVTSAVQRASRFAVGKGGVKDEGAKDAAKTEGKGEEAGGKGQETEKRGDGTTKDTKDTKNAGEGKGAEGKKPGSGESKGGESKGGESKGGESKGGESKGGKAKGGESKGGKAKGGEAKGRSAEAESKTKEEGSEKADQRQEQEKSAPDRQEQSPSKSEQPSPQRSNPTELLSKVSSLASQTFGTLLKLLLYGGLLIGGLIAAWIYREEIKAAWAKLMEELREMWEKWFGKKTTSYTGEVGSVEPPPRTFGSFADPFLTGQAHAMPWPILVRYTFEALEAWGRENGVPRAVDQTPHEFAAAVAAAEPSISGNVQTLAAWYCQLAYAPRAGGSGTPESLRELWANLHVLARRGGAMAANA